MSDLIPLLAGYAAPPAFDEQCEMMEADTRLLVAAAFAQPPNMRPYISRQIATGPLQFYGAPVWWWSVDLVGVRGLLGIVSAVLGSAGPGETMPRWLPSATDADKATVISTLKGRSIE